MSKEDYIYSEKITEKLKNIFGDIINSAWTTHDASDVNFHENIDIDNNGISIVDSHIIVEFKNGNTVNILANEYGYISKVNSEFQDLET